MKQLLIAILLLIAVTTGCGGIDTTNDNQTNIEIGQTTSGLATADMFWVNLLIVQWGDYATSSSIQNGHSLRYPCPASGCNPNFPGPYTGQQLTLRANNSTNKLAVTRTVSGRSERVTQIGSANGYWGECVSFAKQAASRDIGDTTKWSRGINVMAASSNVAVGTIIATFRASNQNGYQSGSDHIGFFGGYTTNASGQRNGFLMFDQNFNNATGESGVVKKHVFDNTTRAWGYYTSNPDNSYVLLAP